MRLLRLLVGLALIPAAATVTRVAWEMLLAANPGPVRVITPGGAALLGGFLLWLLIYQCLPRPMRAYVLAHELTHALWGWAMGARVSDLRVSAQNGSVRLSKTNFLITLAPYFFPLYTVLVMAVYLVAVVFADAARYHMAWLAGIGFTWSFHLTFTVATLLQRQSDIRACGHVFSYAVIYVFNVLGVALWIVLVSPATIAQFTDRLLAGLAEFYGLAGGLLAMAARAVGRQ